MSATPISLLIQKNNSYGKISKDNPDEWEIRSRYAEVLRDYHRYYKVHHIWGDLSKILNERAHYIKGDLLMKLNAKDDKQV